MEPADGVAGQAFGAARTPAAGAAFTLADVVLGLSLNRWLMTPFERPNYAALAAYQQRLQVPRLRAARR